MPGRRQRLRPRPPVKLAIARKLRPPAIHLPPEEILRLSEIAQSQRLMILRAQRRDAVHQRQPHGMAHRGRTGMRFRQLPDRIETVHRLHQVKGDAHHALIAAIRDQPRMRHVRPGQSAQQPRLPPHRLIAVRAGMRRGAAEHIVAPVAAEAQQDILRPSRERRHVRQRAGAKSPVRHPRRQRLDVDRRSRC